MYMLSNLSIKVDLLKFPSKVKMIGVCKGAGFTMGFGEVTAAFQVLKSKNFFQVSGVVLPAHQL